MFCLKNQTAMICVDAGPWVGTRQVNRCLSVAQCLKRFEVHSNFLVPQIPNLLRKKILGLGFGLVEFQSPDECKHQLQQLVANTNPGWLISDGLRDNSLELEFHSNPALVTLETENGRIKIESGCDSLADLNTDFLCGPEYHLAAQDFSTSKTIVGNARKVVVVSSVQESLCELLNAMIDARLSNLSIDAVIRNWDDTQLEHQLKEQGCVLRIHNSFDHLQPCFEFADLSIVDGWDSFWSSVDMGLPTLFFERSLARFTNPLEATGMMNQLNSQNSLAQMGVEIHRFLKNRRLRQEMIAGLRCMNDGLGAERIARALVASRFSIRPCTVHDSEVLYSWRNDPELRVVCFQQDRIPLPSHQEWLQARLKDRDSEIYVIEAEQGKPVGQFRFEFDNDRKAVRLHLSLIPSLRGFGLGTAFIERACRLIALRYADMEVYAYIKSNNSVSQAAFRKATFESVATTTINGQVAIRFHRKPRYFDSSSSEPYQSRAA